MEKINEIVAIIEKARTEYKQKSGMLAYWLHIDNRYIINYANISFLKKDRKETLKVIKEIHNMDGFLFWANSKEGQRFYSEKYNKIIGALKAQQIKPWLSYEYGVRESESEVA